MLWIIHLLACASPEPAETDTDADTDSDSVAATCAEATAEGTLALSFRMDAAYLGTFDDGEDAIGPFYGSIYRGEDVTGIGPDEGAEPLADIEVVELDLREDGGPSPVLWVSGPLPACTVSVLGCLDSDANGCDAGDMVTMPNDNFAGVSPDAETAFEVFLGIRNPG